MGRKRKRSELGYLKRRIWELELENLRDEVLEEVGIRIRERELLRSVPGVV